MKKLKWIMRLTVLFSVFASVSLQAPQAALVEKVVAVVNERIIMLSELHEEIESVTLSPEIEVKAKEVLNAMIDRTLLEQEAAKRKISVSDEEVKAIVKNQWKSLNLDEKNLAQELKKQNLTEELFYRQWKHQILSRRLLDYVTKGSIAVTDQEIEDYHKEHYGNEEAGSGKRMKISHILITDEAEDALLKATEIAELAKSGEPFSELAKEHSMDPLSAKNGGLLGYFSEGDLVVEIEEAVLNTEVDDIAGPVKTASGYHVIKVLEKTEEESRSVSRYKDRIKREIYASKVEKFINSWLTEVKKSSYIEVKI